MSLPTNRAVKKAMLTFAAAHGIEPVKLGDNETWGQGAKALAWRITEWARHHGHPQIDVSTAKSAALVALVMPAPSYTIRRDFAAAHHGGRRPLSAIKYIVVHDGELYLQAAGAHGIDGAAEAMGRYFAGGSVAASPHFGVDNDSIQQYLDLDVIGWHCTRFNTTTVGIEQGGFAVWPAKDWQTHCAGQLDRVAWLLAHLCRQLGLPLVFRSAAYLRAHGANPPKAAGGITTHWEHTKALCPGDHTDPGPNYPMADVIAKARRYAS